MSRFMRATGAVMAVIIISAVLTGCYDNTEIEDLAYVVAIGIDEADNNSFNLTFQTAVPQAISGGGGEGTDITSFKTDNFLSGLKKTGEYLSRKINLSHTKILVVSEEVANKGVIAFLNGLQHQTEIRQDINIIVAAEGAKNYIESIQPKLSSNPAKYYELLFKSYETDFLVPATQLEDYLYRSKNREAQPIAIYTAVDSTINESKAPESGGGGDNKKSGGGTDKKKSGGGSSGQQSGEKEKKNMSIKGLAVFKADKMVGKLNADEASIFALMTGAKSINFDVIDPMDTRFKVLSSIRREKSSHTKVRFVDGKPVIDINIRLDIDVQSVQSDTDFDRQENADRLNNAYSKLLEDRIKNLLKKTTYDFKSDIFGYGELAKRNFATMEAWRKTNWSELFPEARYNLYLQTEIIKHG